MPLRERLQHLVDEMVDRGIRYPDALKEFEKHFLAAGIARADGHLGRAADLLGVHRNTLSRKVSEHSLRR